MTDHDRSKPVLAAIEGGGTKFVCAVGASHNQIYEQTTLPTRNGPETLEVCTEFFQACQDRFGTCSAFGVGIFGPIDITHQSNSYGQLLAACKPGWEGFNIAANIQEVFDAPVAVDTDVNAAILAEMNHGAARGLHSAAYITVGTGIGVGLCINGETVKGRLHPELGHAAVPKMAGDTHQSVCPFHDDCFEGFASGPALKARTGMAAETLPADHPVWDTEAYYLAQLCRTVSYAASPERIVMGGGVMKQAALLPKIHDHFIKLGGGFSGLPTSIEDASDYIVPQQLDGVSGLHGAFLLAERALTRKGRKKSV